MKNIYSLLFLGMLSTASFAQSNLAKDREAIKSLAGHYEVTFNYAETFSPDNAYKFHPRHESHASELVEIIEETPNKIVMQHVLLVGKDMVIKHWREDWVYEAPSMLVYDKDNTWKTLKVTPAQAKGTWVQKVYQVDDSPRYEGRGTWVHVDGKHMWQSETDSPLPRRESSTRSDYNVLRRMNRIYLTPQGWMFEQDNKKLVREASGDKLIAQEKGLEEFRKIDPASFGIVKSWWAGQANFWKAVRSVWDTKLADQNIVKLHLKLEDKHLYDHLFKLATTAQTENWSADKSRSEAETVISKYLATGIPVTSK